MRDGFVNTEHGRIHFKEAGSGGEPLVLLHSNGSSCSEFEGSFPRLARQRRVIAWDMPGQGDSDPIVRHYSIGMYADALVQLLDALGIKRATIAGASSGGVVAVDLAARYRERVSKLLLVEMPLRDEDAWAKNWQFVEEMFSIPYQTKEAIAPRFKYPVSEKLHARWNIDRHKAGGKTMMDVMWAAREYDLGLSLSGVMTSTLLIFGDRSPVFALADLLLKRLRQSRLAVILGCGHFPMIDEPEQFDRAIAEFA